MDKNFIYDVDLFIGALKKAKGNDIMSVNKDEMNLIYSVIEGKILVTPTMLKSLPLDVIDSAMRILSDYIYAGKDKNNPLNEMQKIVTAKNVLFSHKPRFQIVGDEDYF